MIALLCIALYLIAGFLTVAVLMQQRSRPNLWTFAAVVLAWPIILWAEVLREWDGEDRLS